MHKKLLQKQEGLAIIIFTGVWRSLVARTAGGREVDYQTVDHSDRLFFF